jgi:hypothetical protein
MQKETGEKRRRLQTTGFWMNRYTRNMGSAVAVFVMLSLLGVAGVDGQRRQAPRKPAPRAAPPAPLTTAAADVKCPESLGKGMKTGASYCFVLAGSDPAQGVIVTIPSHAGPATLMFDLHNRHTYSEEDVRAGRAFSRYTAGIGVLTMTGELLSRAAVRSEFRTVGDLHERISGGAGPGGAKAVAPIGSEQVFITIPAGVDQVSLLGELLEAVTSAGRETATPGRTVAVVSNLRVEYRPGPPKRAVR